jgi:hypothetical protein
MLIQVIRITILGAAAATGMTLNLATELFCGFWAMLFGRLQVFLLLDFFHIRCFFCFVSFHRLDQVPVLPDTLQILSTLPLQPRQLNCTVESDAIAKHSQIKI